MPWYSLALVSNSFIFFNDYTCIMIGKMSLLYHFNTNIMEKSIEYTTCWFEGNGYMVLFWMNTRIERHSLPSLCLTKQKQGLCVWCFWQAKQTDIDPKHDSLCRHQIDHWQSKSNMFYPDYPWLWSLMDQGAGPHLHQPFSLGRFQEPIHPHLKW